MTGSTISGPKVTNPMYAYLAEALKLNFDSGVTADTNFCDHVTIHYLAIALEAFSEIRGHVLHTVCGMPEEQGRRKSSHIVENMLADALDPTVDTAHVAHNRLRETISWLDWPLIIGEQKAFEALVLEHWYERSAKGLDELIVAHLKLISKHGLLTAEEKLSAVLEAGYPRKLPLNILQQLVDASSVHSVTREIYSASEMLEILTDQILVTALGTKAVMESVFGAVAKKHHLLKENAPARTGVTLTPAAFIALPEVVQTPPPSQEDELPPALGPYMGQPPAEAPPLEGARDTNDESSAS